MIRETMIDSDGGVFVVTPSATCRSRPKQLSQRDRKIYNVFLALCTLSFVQTICLMSPPQIYRTRSPKMTYHIEGEEHRVISWDKSTAFSVFLVPPSNAFPLITTSLFILYFLKKSNPQTFLGKTSESLDTLKRILRDSFKSAIPSARSIGELIVIHLAASLWLAFNWIIVDLFLKGGSIFGAILSVGSSAALSYFVVMRLGRQIEENEEDFHAGVAGGGWEEVLVEKE